jgi:asparagine synthase (glutamine-hydrolysing)
MCGIAGIVSFDSRYVPPREVLERMSACIAHRGPDGEGIEVIRTPSATAGLVHRRLAILDPDPRSNQPFTIEHEGRRFHLVFNGEIYNYRELRRELEPLLPGYAWRTTGDTEVLLASYLAWGEQCAEHLLGMFAFGVFDETSGAVFLARDRMGQKPLYYALTGEHDRIAFASELSALAGLEWVNSAVSELSVTAYLSRGYIPSPGTIYEGIEKLPPAHTLTLRPGAVARVAACWPTDPPPQPPPPAPHAPVLTRQLLEQSVRSQLVSDVPLGCLLSGGIDSSIVTLLMKRTLPTGQPLHTFTLAFDDPRYDESRFAEQVAGHLGTTHHTFHITPDVAGDLPALARSFGEPFADSSLLPTYYLARETRQHVKVALGGDGGDELFAGYDRYRALRLAQRLSPLLRLLPDPPGSWLGAHPKSHVARLARFWSIARLPVGERYDALTRFFPPGVLGAPGYHDVLQPFQRNDPLLSALAFDRRHYLEGDLLTKVDRASMLVNLEVRSPFMDHRLVQYASQLRTVDLLRHGMKGILKRAFAHDLPPAVFTRPKMGFALPIGEWLRTSMRDMLRDLVLSPAAVCSRWPRAELERLIDDHHERRADHSQRLFALIMLELWHRQRPR